MSRFNPHLAAEAILGQINYGEDGLYALPKYNGVRGGVQSSLLLSRQLKPIPNDYIRTVLSDPSLSNYEGEIVVGDYGHEDVFVRSTSGVMTEAGFPDFTWFMFDMYHPTLPFYERLRLVHAKAAEYDDSRLQAVHFKVVHNDAELVAFSDECLSKRFEGVVLRDPYSLYKEGRSTELEGSFMRFVPWHKGEAVILDIIEGKVNKNESVRNELGYLEKSSHKENKVGSGRAGSFLVQDLKTGIQFKMPVPGVELQNDVMQNKSKYLAKVAHYQFKSPVKRGGAPRFPQYLGLRHPDDMS